MQVIVQRDAPFLDARVGCRLDLVPVTARERNNEVCEAHVLDEFVRRLAQLQDLFRQVDANHFLEMVGELRLEGYQRDDLRDLLVPSLVKVSNVAYEVPLLEEVPQLKPAHLFVVYDSLVLPAQATDELVYQ